MKRTDRKMPLRRQIFYYIAAFVGVILVFLWVLQTVFLDQFYEQGMRRAMRGCAVKTLENEDADFSNVVGKYDMSIIVYDRGGNVLKSNAYFSNNYLEQISPYVRAYLYKMTLENGGSLLTMVHEASYEPFPAENDSDVPRRMLYSRIDDKDGRMVVVEAMLTPIGGTAETLRVQLIWSSVLFLLLGGIFATMISCNISRPLVKINQSAKQLAQGNYQADFTVKGSSSEVQELAVTLNSAAQELSRVEELRRELLANISHDLRTPLTMITAYAEMMRDLPGEQTPENVQVIIDEANRLTALVSDLLDLSRLQSGAHHLHQERFNLTECLRTLLDRYNKLIDQENYDIRFSYDREVYVVADELKITQAAYNLINNAVNYTGDDKHVEVNQITEDGKVRVEIVDTGEGISQEQLKYIWERYYRASENRHHREKMGSGIGLSIVREVMEVHHARYGVRSEVGKGSVFWFELTVSE